MQRDTHAHGDDNNGIDDETTVKLLGDITVGGIINTIVSLSGPPSREGDASYIGSFGMWVDYNQDGDWDDADEKVLWTYVYGSFSMQMEKIIGIPFPATAKTGA